MVVESPVGQTLENVNVAAASGVLGTFDTRAMLDINVDIFLETLTGGTAPTVTFFLDRALPVAQSTPNNGQRWVQIAASAALSVVSVPATPGGTESNVVKFIAGPGLSGAHLSARQVRIRWATTGAPGAAVASAYLTSEASYD